MAGEVKLDRPDQNPRPSSAKTKSPSTRAFCRVHSCSLILSCRLRMLRCSKVIVQT